MDQGRIPKDLFYGELAIGSRKTGRPRLRYKDVCKRDMKSASIETADWERLAHDRSIWRSIVREGTRNADMRRKEQQAKKGTVTKAEYGHRPVRPTAAPLV